jgi:hypothetical protein
VRRGGPREPPGSAEGTAAEPSGGTRRYSAGAALRRRVESQGARHFALSAYTCARRCRQRRCSLWCAATVPPRGRRSVIRCAAAVATMQRLQRLQRFIKRKVCLFAAVRAFCARAFVRVRACVRACRARRRSPTRVGRADAVEVLPVSVSVRTSLTARRSPVRPHCHFERSGARVAAGFTPMQFVRSFVVVCLFVCVPVCVCVFVSPLGFRHKGLCVCFAVCSDFGLKA